MEDIIQDKKLPVLLLGQLLKLAGPSRSGNFVQEWDSARNYDAKKNCARKRKLIHGAFITLQKINRGHFPRPLPKTTR